MNTQKMLQTVKKAGAALAVVASLFMGQIPVAQAAGVNFEKVDTETRGAINFGTLAQCGTKVYTPVSDSDGKLRVIHSSLIGNDLASLPQQGNAHVGGAIAEVEVAGINGCNFFVTASRDASNTLKLISWFSGANGIERLGDSSNHGQFASEMAVASTGFDFDNAIGRGYVVTAVRGAGNNLVVTSWNVDQSNIEIVSTEIEEQASQIAIVKLPQRPEDAPYITARMVVAYKNSAGNLKLVYWKLDAYGGLHRIADSGNQAGNVQQIAIARYNTNEVVTAVKNSEGNLQMIPWKLYEDSIDRLEGDGPEFNQPIAGGVQEIDITNIDFAHPLFKHVVTAVRTTDGNLRLIAWGIDPAGNVIRQSEGENMAGAATNINVEWASTASRVITSMRDSEGKLRIIAWRVFP